MATTRSGLQAAQIINTNNQQAVSFMFNPSDYTIVKTNTYEKKNKTGQDSPDIKFQQGAARSLNSLKLIFDTYQDGADAEDVREYIKPLADMMKVVSGSNPPAPPIVQFVWGGLTFKAVIESLTQVFKLFKADGTPVRAEVTVNLTEVPDSTGSSESASAFAGADTVLAAIFKGLPPGTPIPQISATVSMIAGTTLSLVAGGAGVSYRAVAELNNIDNPLRVPNGTPVNIPSANVSASASSGPPPSSGGSSNPPSAPPQPSSRPGY